MGCAVMARWQFSAPLGDRRRGLERDVVARMASRRSSSSAAKEPSCRPSRRPGGTGEGVGHQLDEVAFTDLPGSRSLLTSHLRAAATSADDGSAGSLPRRARNLRMASLPRKSAIGYRMATRRLTGIPA
jgi:hypothetical protein